MAGRNHDTAGYEMTVEISLIEVNAYGDHLGKGELTFTKRIKANGLSGLGQFLADVESLGELKPKVNS